MADRLDSGRRPLTGLSYEAFISPTDKTALENLRRLPMLEALVRNFNEMALDRVLYAQNSATSVRCSEKQFPTLYNIMREACAILDAPEPELYMRYDPVYNAYTAGIGRPFIILHSELIEGFTDDELLFIIGHEIGHIKCGHVLYMMMARVLMPLLDIIGKMTAGVGQMAGIAIVSAFYEWLRQAEFSCDRAGLLACQKPRVALSALMKLGSGSSRLNREMSVDAFLEQAHAYSKEMGAEGLTKAVLFFLYNWQLSHPQVVFRAKELDEWATEGNYLQILRGGYRGPNETGG